MTKPKLLVTTRNLRQAKGIKAIGYITISPLDFLLLTTRSTPMQWIAKEDAEGVVHTVEQYNAWQRDGNAIHMPWLDISFRSDHNGKIVGHEGRHRAAALIKAGYRTDKVLPCAVRLYEEGKYPAYYEQDWETFNKRYLGIEDVPTTWFGQYDGHKVEPPLDTFRSFYHAKQRMVAQADMYRVLSRLETV